jgi:SAM-dependent methyltransferase
MERIAVTPERLHLALKARDKAVYPEGPNPDVPWYMIISKYLSEANNWLDVGCGTGFYTGEAVRLAGTCPELTITDRDVDMLEYAAIYLDSQELNPKVVSFDELNSIGSASYGLITCRDETVADTTLSNLLAPGGILIRFFPVKDLKWSDRLSFILSRQDWLEEKAQEIGLEPVEAKGWGSKWSTDLESLVEYIEVSENRIVGEDERAELLALYGVGAGVCVEEFGQYGVFRKPLPRT